jgi:hypothetical protein
MPKRAKPFMQIDPEDRRGEFFRVRLTRDEKDQVLDAARMRALSPAEFARRALLGRKAELRVENEIILAIREVAGEVKKLHLVMTNGNLIPPEEKMRQVLDEAIKAILRVSN